MVFPKEKSICCTYLAFGVENRLQSFNLSFKISLSIWDRHFGSLKIINDYRKNLMFSQRKKYQRNVKPAKEFIRT